MSHYKKEKVNTIKKIIVFLVIFTMSICFVLVGCRQNVQGSNATNDNHDESNIVSSTEDTDTNSNTAENIDGDDADPEASVDTTADNMNPKQDNDGRYVYNVQGYEVRLKTNIWDYIGSKKNVKTGEVTENFFNIARLAADLGYDKPYSMDGVYKHEFEDGTYIFAGFQHDGSNNTSYITSGIDFVDKPSNLGSLSIEPFDFDKMDYVYYSKYPISLDSIIMCVYAMEYYADGNTGKCFVELFGEELDRYTIQP